MRGLNKNICETNISNERIVQSGVHASECPALLERGILSLGHARIHGPYKIVRLNPDYEHLTICFTGSGNALIRNQWVPFQAGDAVLSPKQAPHGSLLEEGNQVPLGLIWVIFDRNQLPHSRLGVNEATMIRRAGHSPLSIFEGLEREVVATGDVVSIYHWVELICRSIDLLLARQNGDARLAALWGRIGKNLAHPWTLEEMANVAGLSEGHLRRLCRVELGFGPRHQLARLRIRQVSALLSTTGLTLDQISDKVGYSDPFALSVAYRRITKISPRAFKKSIQGRSGVLKTGYRNR